MVLPNGQFRFMFTAQDYEAAVAFYRDGLGLPLDHDWNFAPDDRGTVFKAGGGMVEVLGAAAGTPVTRPQGGILLMQVDDVDRFYQTAQERGLKVIQAPATMPWGQRLFRVEDPDGIVVTLFAPV
jgi:predicted enzyme related to lactoylglutathione lyase